MINQKSIMDDSITVLKLDIKNLTSVILEQYKKVIRAIKTLDNELALEVIKADNEINTLSEDIDLETILVIAKYQPVASDLRRVMTINKLAYELERIADYAKNLAEYVITGKKLNVTKSPEIISSLERMFDVIFSMLETNLKAFMEEDKILAREALLMDAKIDEMYKQNFVEFLNMFKNATDESVQHMISKALILNKQIERAGDHLTNISEQILYLIKGKRYINE